ncbi:MAG: hypothetical protein ACE5JL_02590 [Dehalococcoidia bacterium]
MTSSIDASLKNRTKLRWLAAVVLASLNLFLLLTGATWYSTTKLESTPVGANTSFARNLAGSEHPADSAAMAVSDEGQAPLASTEFANSIMPGGDKRSYFAPFLDIVPSSEGTELFISAGGVGELGGTIFANVGIGPGGDKRSYTMIYSDTVQAYVATAIGFTPRTSTFGSLNITTTLGLDTGLVDFNRAYVPASTTQTIRSVDGNLELSVVTADTITFDRYVVVVPSYGPHGSPPPGHRFVGSIYSVRASGAQPLTDKPMNLQLAYNTTTLVGADPHTLAIFAWDANGKRWDRLGGQLFYDQQYVSVTVRRFATYALIATPTWRDEFDDFSGLNFPDEVSNVTVIPQGEDQALALSSTATNGIAVSKLIMPLAIDRWGSLIFTRTVDPPTTTLAVDVLSVDGTELLTNVTSGASLAGIDPTQHPSLKLRANLSSTVAGETPALDEWKVTWRVGKHVYLPVVLK